MKTRILFVCLGNICRSPAAEEIFRCIVSRNGVADEFEIDSAGTYYGHAGQLPDPRMRVAASHRGYLLSHRARGVSSDDFERFDMLLAMDDSNYERLARMAPTVEGVEKIYRLIDFASDSKQYTYIPDPYYEGADGFELVLNLLEDACSGLFESLRGKE